MHHAGGRRDGLLPLLIEHLAAGIRTEPHGDWRARLAELGHEIRRVALAHRGLADELLRSGATGPQALRLADAILDALQDAGLDQDVAQDAYDLFLTYVLGSAGRQTTATAPARWRSFEARSTTPSPTPTPPSGAPLAAARPVTTTRASPAASTSSSTPSPPARRRRGDVSRRAGGPVQHRGNVLEQLEPSVERAALDQVQGDVGIARRRCGPSRWRR